jgi:cytochrome oxidase assembly protein ShyY1
VLRTALAPRWLALLLVMLLAATAMVLLGRWQLDRAREHGKEPVERVARAQVTATPKPVEQVIAPRQTFPKDAVNVRVSATGRWDGAHRLLITGRDLGGRPGYWVLVPLRLADGSALPVVRGWVASPSDPAAAGPANPTSAAGSVDPSGLATVQVIGLLQPTEAPQDHAPGQSAGLPADQLARIAATDLVNRWPYPLITGFVVEQSQAPATGPAPALVPPPLPNGGLDLLNVFYAFQWWLFALISLILWWRLVRDDHLRDDHLRDDHLRAVATPEPLDPVKDDVSRVTSGITGRAEHS